MICAGLGTHPLRFCKQCRHWKSYQFMGAALLKRNHNRCKKCYAAYQREYRARNGERVRANERKCAYGPDADLDALMARQGHRCGICRTDTPPGRGWCIDHDHKTGKVRGVLCHFCNVGLGNFRDDPDRLTAAIDWLKGTVA